MAKHPVYESENITMCTDGKYRWVYELNLYKNPAIIKEVGRMMGISLVIVLGLIFIFVMIDTIGTIAERFQFFAELAGIVLAICLVITILGYLLYSYMMGGTYCALFEMDENGVCNKAQEKHIKKAELISAITVIAGIASGRPGVAGTGMLAGAVAAIAVIGGGTYFFIKKRKETPAANEERVRKEKLRQQELQREQAQREAEQQRLMRQQQEAELQEMQKQDSIQQQPDARQPQLGATGAYASGAVGVMGSAQNDATENATQVLPDDTPHFCSNCGAPLKPSSRFCENCGAKVE